MQNGIVATPGQRAVRRVLPWRATDRGARASRALRRAGRVAGLVVALLACSAHAARAEAPVAAHGVIGVQAKHLDPQFWIDAAAASGDAPVAPQAIERMNTALRQIDPTVHDLEVLPATLSRKDVAAWIEPLSRLPARARYDDEGRELPRAELDAMLANAALGAIAAQVPLRFGLITRRADLRRLPTRRRVLHAPTDRDIDRLQESALFPGTPVAILHQSADRRWWFVIAPDYAAWTEQRNVAIGNAAQVFAYTRRTPYVVVTGASVRTVFTPERPQVSQLRLEMGVRLPLRADWPAAGPVNGQHPYAARVIELPQRGEDGALEWVPALLPPTAEVAPGYLALTPANVVRQGFKFLGERYGWGHGYEARDCSGFVAEVYRSFGVQLPRNTGDQAASAAFDRIVFGPKDTREQRLAVIRRLRPGDLVYIPGHVMMVLGRDEGQTYVIHDTVGISYREGASLRRVTLNSVAVTTLEPLHGEDGQAYVDRIYSIQRIRPRASTATRPE